MKIKMQSWTFMFLFLFSLNSSGQIIKDYLKQMGNPNANYYSISSQIDSILHSSFSATVPDNEAAAFSRWDWFWQSRMGDAIDQSKLGRFNHYYNALYTIYHSPICSPYPQYAANWQLLGPTQLPRQEIGRMDVVKRDPNNVNRVYAGAPNSGLWRTNNINTTVPTWINITDDAQLSGLGVSDILIDPNNSDIIYIATGLLSWGGGYGLGVLKTTNGTSSSPTWNFTGLQYNPLASDVITVRKLLMHPTNSNIIYAITDDEVFRTLNAGTTWPSFGFSNATGGSNLNLHNIVLDPTNSSNVIVSGEELWRYDNSTSSWVNQTGNLSGIPNSIIRLAPSGNNIYALYRTTTEIIIDISTNGGTSWSQHTVTDMYGDHFIVSPLNQDIMYIGDGRINALDRVVWKSIDGGASFIRVSQYNQAEVHADIRGLTLVEASNDGLEDILLAATDGGISYSISSVPPNGTTVNWVNANGNGLSVSEFYGISNSELETGRIIGGTQDNGFSTYEYGSWVNTIVGDGYLSIIDKENPNIVIGERIGSANQFLVDNTYFTNSDNGGQTWQFNMPQPRYCNQNNALNHNYSPDIWNVKARPLVVNEANELYLGFHDLFKFDQIANTWIPLSDFTAKGVDRFRGCGALAIAHSDPDVIYFAFEHPTYDATNSIVKKLWKTVDGGTNWTDITSGLPVNWGGITDIAIDPFNEDRIWVSFNGVWPDSNLPEPYNGQNRVYHSKNGGLSWEEYSKGLTPLPVNSIIYKNGSDDEIFIGTDVGVFYTNKALYDSDDPGNGNNVGWVCYTENLPPCIVTDLKFNYSTNSLRAATFGRGIWESTMSCTKDPTPITIDQNTTWNCDMVVNSDVVIKSGVILTVEETALVSFVAGAKVIVEPGGKLIIDGGRLTKACDKLWQGIELQGKSDQSQYTHGAQGQVILKNGAVIENARTGITTIANSDDPHNYDFSTTGGIIKANGSTFRNCVTGIHFLDYTNTHPATGNEMPNISYIKNCIFETTENFYGGKYPDAFIKMENVQWVKILGNTFQNINPTADPDYLGEGINSIDSKYKVSSYCSSGTYPCLSEDKNEFNNLRYGIRATATQSTYPVTVEDAIFDKCHFGVYLGKVGFATIINNEFIVSDWYDPMSRKNKYGYGLYLAQSNNYKVEGNLFHSVNPRGWTGIYISNGNLTNNTAADEIYRNEFDNLYSAIVALNDNDGPDDYDGLTFHCNWFTNNTYDITAMPWTDTRTSVGAIQGIELIINPDPNLLVRNYYSADCTGNENRFLIDWNPQTPQEIKHTSYAGPNWLPPAGCADPYILMEESDNNTVYDPFHCEDRTGLDPIIIEIELEEISLKKAELNDIIDGGQTALLVSIAQSNMPKGQILQSMMEFSPYLSDEVLLALIERPNPLPPGTMQQILLANSPLSTAVFTAVQGMNPALPNGIFNQIANSQTGGLSDRDMIPLVEAIYTQKESLLISDLVRYYLNDTLSVNPMDSVVKILSNVQYKDAKINLVSAYIETKNFNKAHSLMDSLVYVEPELDAFADKQELSIMKANQPGGVYSILNDSVAIQILNTISADTSKFGSLYAMNMIEAIGDSVYEELTLIPTPDMNNRNMLETPPVTTSKNSAYLNCYPNPATEKINIEFSIYNDAENKFILLYNVKGQEVYREEIFDPEGIKSISVPETGGTYYIYIEANGSILAIDKIVVL